MSDEEIRSFAILADADSFIKELPGGYNYTIVKGGANLSVGQKQRIVLARAFARQPMIMLLDEPTAALDNENAYRVIENLKNIKGITKIVTTHNTTLKPMFDQVIAI
jgi:ABC-type bacteriocin/lantibiotic exporter with double-glycine peptidase domain